MIDVRVERADLDDGTPAMFRDFGSYVRLAHDPEQMDESAALALLCLRMPQLVGNMNVQRAQ